MDQIARRFRCLISIFAISVLLAGEGISASASPDVKLSETHDLSFHWSLSVDIAVKDTFVLHLTPFGVQVSNLMSAQDAEVLSQTEISGLPLRMDVDGDLLYVITGANSLQIFDLSGLPQLWQVSEMTVGQSPQDIAASGQIVYILDQDTVRVLDCSDPTSPFQTAFASLGGEYSINSRPAAIRVCGSHLLVSATLLRIFDISSPTSPHLLASIDSQWDVSDAVCSDSIVYVADKIGSDYSVGDFLRSYVFHSDGQYSLLDSVEFPWRHVARLQLRGDTLYSTHEEQGIAVWDVSGYGSLSLIACGSVMGAANDFVLTDSGLLVNFRLLEDWEGRDAYGVCDSGPALIPLDGNPEYPESWSGGEALRIVLNESGALEVAGFLLGRTRADLMDLEGTRLMIRDRTAGISVVTLPDSVGSAFVGQVCTSTHPGDIGNIVLGDNFACLASGDSLYFVDISNPANVHVTSTLPQAGSRMDAQGSMLALAQGTGEVALYDCTDPSNPVETDFLLFGSVSDVALNGSMAYIAEYDSRILVLDISTPGAMSVIDSVSAPVRRLEVIGDKLAGYTATGIYFFDIQSPASPQISGIVMGLFDGTDGRLLLRDGDGFSGFTVYEVTEGYFPVEICQIHTLFAPQDFVFAGNYLYVADYYGVLRYPIDVLTDVGEEPSQDGELPGNYVLKQNYPNPFNPATTIGFSIARQEQVSLHVYNILGRKVATLIDEVLPAGDYSVDFSIEGSGLGSGVYFYRLVAGQSVLSRKMLVLK